VGLGGIGLALLLGVSVPVLRQRGYRINETASVPIGIWRVEKSDHGLRRGDIVSICPPATLAFQLAAKRAYLAKGGCASGLQPLLKPVAAVSGDVVAAGETGITVNGEALQHTRARPVDRKGRALPPFPAGTYTVQSGEVWVLAKKDGSFDSRYFGPVPASGIEGVAKAVWVETE
jgi:conjugative transfer signal peptidase TraF